MFVVAISALLLAQASPDPDFLRYVTAVRAHPPRSVTVQHHTPWTRRFQSSLSLQAARPVDFAGRYALASIGCGAGCLMIGAVDRWTGRVIELRPTICCWPDDLLEPLSYRADSRLLIVQGRLDEAAPAGTYRFVLQGGRFERLPDRPGGVSTRP